MTEKLKDPICGMEVDSSSEYSVETDEGTVYFCSEHCRQKFIGAASATHRTDLAGERKSKITI